MKFADNVPLDVRSAIGDLVRMAHDRGFTVCGFAFASDLETGPFMMNFGNCSDYGEIELYQELCSIADEKRRQGMVRAITPTVVQ